MFVGGVVVQHHMDLQIWRDSGIDLFEKLQPLDMPVARLALRDHASVQNVERRKQRDCSMTLVIVGHGLSPPVLERQPWLGPVQRLHLALLVTAQHHRTLGRVHVQTHDIGELVLEADVVGDFEGSAQMRLGVPSFSVQ